MASKKITIEHLLEMKSKKDKISSKEVEIKSLGGKITIQKCKYDVVLNVMDVIANDGSMGNIVEVFKELIYKSVPLFRNAELLKEYEIIEPMDIVTELLNLAEIVNLGNDILQMYGFDGLADEVKN